MENPMSFKKFLVSGIENIIFLVVAHFLIISAFVYSLIEIFKNKNILEGICLLALSLLWYLGYYIRLKSDYKAYLDLVKNKEQENGK